MKKIWAVLALTIVFLTPSIVKAEETDPCWDGNCSYNVNATTGKTTIIRLSDEEIAQRNSYVPPVVVTPNPEPKYDLVVITPNQSFGTSGTIQQLTEVVVNLESQSKNANDSKYDEPCLYQDCVKYVADGTKGTVEIVDITYRELRNRFIDRLGSAEQLNELALKAREALSEIEVMSKSMLPLIELSQIGN